MAQQRGSNFHRYDKDGSGEIDMSELKNAVMEWSEFARIETEERHRRRNEAMVRKRELAEERRQMLANADSRAAEIMVLCEKNSGDGRNLTVHGLRTYLEPIRKLKPFVNWMLGNRMAVFKKYDKDKSGTIDLEELELALDEYFDEVASEFDEFRGDYQSKEMASTPPPPVFKCFEEDTAVFEWRNWKGYRLNLQCIKTGALTEDEARAAEEAGSARWTTIYSGETPRAEVFLSEPTSLYVFRTIRPAGIGPDGKAYAEIPSTEVFWMSRPSKPTITGLGRNLLVSWQAPLLPPTLARALKPPRPFWRIYVADKNHPAKAPVVTMVGMDRTWSLAKGLSHSAPRAMSSHEGFEAGKHTAECLEGGQKTTEQPDEPNLFDISITCEFPVSESNKSKAVAYSTTLAPVFASASGAEVVKLEMPELHDPDGALAEAGICGSYRLEGLSASNEWETIHRGKEASILLRGLPPNVLCVVRARCTLDLRACCRIGSGAIHMRDPGDQTANPLRSLGLAPGAAFGSVYGENDGKNGDDTVSMGSDTTAQSRNVGSSNKRSRQYSILTTLKIQPSKEHFWDVNTPTQLILAPCQLVFEGSATDYSENGLKAPAREVLSLFWDEPRGITPAVEVPQPRYALEVFDVANERWARVYTGDEPFADLARLSREAHLPRSLRPEQGVCQLLRIARELTGHSAMYSDDVVVFLAPLPPVCTWTDASRSSVRISWDGVLDMSRLPAGASPMPFHFILEVASGPLIAFGQGGRAKENAHPLTAFEELARAPAAFEMLSGLLLPGMRYAFRLRCETCHGSSCSQPFYVQTRPTAPSAPTVPSAQAASFRSATGRIAPFVQLRWRQPAHNGLPVDRYLVQARRAVQGVETMHGSKEWLKEHEWGMWMDLYLGPHLIAGDHHTLRGSLVRSQYRVRAGSQLGWGKWSSVLTVKGVLSQDKRKVAELSKLGKEHRHFRVHHHHTHTRKTMNSSWKTASLPMQAGATTRLAPATFIDEEEEAMANADAARNPLSPLKSSQTFLGAPLPPHLQTPSPLGANRATTSNPNLTVAPRNTMEVSRQSPVEMSKAMAQAEQAFVDHVHDEDAAKKALQAKTVPEVGETGIQLAIWEQLPKVATTPAPTLSSKQNLSVREDSADWEHGDVVEDESSKSVESYSESESDDEDLESFADNFEDINAGTTLSVQGKGSRTVARRMTVRASVNFGALGSLTQAAIKDTDFCRSHGVSPELAATASGGTSINRAAVPPILSGRFPVVGGTQHSSSSKVNQVALTVEGESAGGLGGGAQKLQITLEQLEVFGLIGLMNKDITQTERDAMVMQLYEKLQVDESGMLTCSELESKKKAPSKPEKVVLVTRSPLTFFLLLASNARYFVRLSGHGRPGCELEGLEARRKEKCFLRINASQLESMGCAHLWRCSEAERVDITGALCRQIEIDQETGQMSIPGMPNERMMLPLLEKRRTAEGTPSGCASVEWNPAGFSNLESALDGTNGSFGARGGRSVDSVNKDLELEACSLGTESIGTGAPIESLDEESLGDLSLNSWGSRTDKAQGKGGSSRVSVSAEGSKTAAWDAARTASVIAEGVLPEGGISDIANLNMATLEEKVMSNVKRVLGFPVSERVLRRVIHNMVTGQPVESSVLAGSEIEEAGTSGLCALADAVSAATAQEAAVAKAVVASNDAKKAVERNKKKVKKKMKKKEKMPAYRKFGLAFPIKDLKPYATAAPHMTEKDWAEMPLPLHGFHNVVQLPPIPMMSLKWGAGRDLVMMRGLHDVLADTRKHVPSVIAMDRPRYLRRIGFQTGSK